MKVLGTVKDATTEVPLPGAKIKLYVREEELAVLQSDSEGKFKHKSESQYLGEILICKVEKAGYEPQKVIQEFEEDEVTLAIKLVPKKEEKIELTFNLKDEKRTPLKGVNISLEVNGEGVGVGISDKDGIFKIALSPDLEGKTINYDAELAGFGLASGALLLKKETYHEITMKKITMKNKETKSMEKILKGAKGVNGQLELLENKIRIKRMGALSLMTKGLKWDKEILINQISSIQFKNAGALGGYIQFAFLGDKEAKGGIFQATRDENTILFSKAQQSDFEEIKSMIEKRMAEPEGKGTPRSEIYEMAEPEVKGTPRSEIYDLEKLAELKEKGIISEEEFNAKKKQILGL